MSEVYNPDPNFSAVKTHGGMQYDQVGCQDASARYRQCFPDSLAVDEIEFRLIIQEGNV